MPSKLEIKIVKVKGLQPFVCGEGKPGTSGILTYHYQHSYKNWPENSEKLEIFR